MRRRGGLTLLEVVVAAGLVTALVLLLSTSLFAVQRSVRHGLTEEAVAAMSRRVAELVADQLRDLNQDDQDVEPDAAALIDFHPVETDRLRYRTLVGFDPDSAVATLSPRRSTGAFSELYRAGTDLMLSTPRTGGPIKLARGVNDLRLDLDASSAPARLRIRIVSDRPHPDEPGRTVRGTAELTVLLQNALAAAD